MNKYYCTGEEIENGYLKVVVPIMDEPDKNDFYEYDDDNPHYPAGIDMEGYKDQMKYWDEHLKDLPLAALVVGGKTGWLDEKDYEIDYRKLSGTGILIPATKWEHDNPKRFSNCYLVLVKKPEQKSEDGIANWLIDQSKEKPAGERYSFDEVVELLSRFPVVEDRPKWVKASERLPDDTKKDRPLYIRKTDSYYIGWLSLTRDIWVTINDDFNKNEDIEWLEEP